jgi:hypothetical protein
MRAENFEGSTVRLDVVLSELLDDLERRHYE